MTDPITRGRRRIGMIRYQDAQQRFEVRLVERKYERPKSTYIYGPDDAKTKVEAEAELARRIAAKLAGVRSTGRTMTLDRWLDDWLELQAGKPKTVDMYRTRLRLYVRPQLGRYRLADLEAVDISRALMNVKGERVGELRPATIQAAYKVLSAALNDAWLQGKAPRNAALAVSIDGTQREIIPPSPAELDAILDQLDGHPWRPLFSVLRWSGARLSEVRGLTRHHFDRGDGTITILRQPSGRLKTKASRRTLVLPRLVHDELLDMPRRADTPMLFATSSGAPIDGRNLLRAFDQAAERAGVRPPDEGEMAKYRIHDLRHAFATLALEAGASQTHVAAWLGHGSLRMLDRYSHVHPRSGGEAYRRMTDAFGAECVHLFGMRSDHSGDHSSQRRRA